jgi:hypothetical protein
LESRSHSVLHAQPHRYGTATVEGAELVITIELGPRMDDQGSLNLCVDKVKVGAIPVTLVVKPMAKKMYRERIASTPIDMQDWRTKVVASLLNEESFESRVEDKWVRLEADITTANSPPASSPSSETQALNTATDRSRAASWPACDLGQTVLSLTLSSSPQDGIK